MALRFGAHVSVGVRAHGFGLLASVASIGVSILFGLKGNEWRDAALRRRRFRYRAVVQARSPAQAVLRYFEAAVRWAAADAG